MRGDIPQGNATYDAVTANIGATWKMPTSDQCRELINNTTSEWTTINEVNGRKLINKSNSSKYIFLPASGVWNATTHVNAREWGYYWSSTYRDSNNAWAFNFNSNTNNAIYYTSAYRYYGFSIRGIK